MLKSDAEPAPPVPDAPKNAPGSLLITARCSHKRFDKRAVRQARPCSKGYAARSRPQAPRAKKGRAL